MVQQALIGIRKAVQARLCGACRDFGGGGEDWSGEGQRSVRGSNGGCGVWPRVADRLMNGRSGEFKRVGRQGEPVLIHDDYILISFFFLLCCFFVFFFLNLKFIFFKTNV